MSAVALIFMSSAHPGLYPVQGSVKQTAYHADIGDLKKQSFNTSTDLLPLMQELLGYSGTIAVTLRKADIESASSDLARYTSRYHDLQNLIIKLDMNESEISQFSKSTKEQKDLISQFVSSSESLKSLEKLEIQYQEEEDPDSVTKVRLQGKALKSRIQTLQNQYADVTDELVTRGNTLGVDTSPATKSKAELDQLTGMVAQRQSDRDRFTRFADTDSPHISFLSQPTNVTFLDPVELSGFISGHQESQYPVQIYLDGIPFLEMGPDEIGEFRSSFTVHNLSAGEHMLFARWGRVSSLPTIIQVTPLDTAITLRVQPVKGMSAINLTGTLTAQAKVPKVPVQILARSELSDSIFTDNTGTYLHALPVSAGTSEIFARFDNLSYPLHASESVHYLVTSDGESITSVTTGTGSSFPPVLFIIPLVGILIIPVLYFWRKGILFGKEHESSEENSALESGGPDSTSGFIPPDEFMSDARHSASDISDIHDLISDPTAEARQIYLRVLSFLSVRHAQLFSPAHTPREVSAQIPGIRCRESFTSFIRAYESIRYGGCQNDSSRDSLKNAAQVVKASCRRKDEE